MDGASKSASQSGEMRVYADAEAVASAGAELFVTTCRAAIAARGRFRIALSGGSTPRRTYELLASPQFRSQIDWPRVDFFWGDERYVPPDHADNNYRMVREALLRHVSVADEQVHRVHTELGSASAAAGAYEDAIRRCFGTCGIPRFDLIYLGLGTNGHTASLFPHSPALHETDRLVLADFVAEVNMWRITMTAPLLNAGDAVAFLVAGRDKAQVLREVVSGSRDVERLPAQLIRPDNGELFWIVDRAAAAQAA